MDHIDLILMKQTDYTFDLDVMTQRTNEGRIKLFLGIDKVRKQNSVMEKDMVNSTAPYRLGFKRFNQGKSFMDRIKEMDNDVELIENVQNELKCRMPCIENVNEGQKDQL